MKQPEDTMTVELPGITRPGRRPAGERPMTNAERQRAYRERRKSAQWVPNSALDELSRVELMHRLSGVLAVIDGQSDDGLTEGAQYIAQQCIAEIVTRYGLHFAAVKRKVKPSRVTESLEMAPDHRGGTRVASLKEWPFPKGKV